MSSDYITPATHLDKKFKAEEYAILRCSKKPLRLRYLDENLTRNYVNKQIYTFSQATLKPLQGAKVSLKLIY